MNVGLGKPHREEQAHTSLSSLFGRATGTEAVWQGGSESGKSVTRAARQETEGSRYSSRGQPGCSKPLAFWQGICSSLHCKAEHYSWVEHRQQVCWESRTASTGSSQPHPEPAPLKALKPSSSRLSCLVPLPGSALPRDWICFQPTSAPLPQHRLCDLHRSDLVRLFQDITIPRYSASKGTTVCKFTIQKQ